MTIKRNLLPDVYVLPTTIVSFTVPSQLQREESRADVSTSTSGQVRYFNPTIAGMLFKRGLKENKAGVHRSDHVLRGSILQCERQKTKMPSSQTLDDFIMTSDIASLQRYSRSVSCTVGGGVGAVEHAN